MDLLLDLEEFDPQVLDIKIKRRLWGKKKKKSVQS